MKDFLKKSVLFSLAALVLLLSCEIYNIHFSHSYMKKVNGWEVYVALLKSKTKYDVSPRRLIIGDSVAMQMYPCDKEHGEDVSLSCNQAISLAGHYFLLYNYLKTNEDALPSEIVLLLHPYTLGNDLDKFAFHYFLKPFYTSEYKGIMSDCLVKRIHEIPFYWLSQFPFVKTSNYTVSYELTSENYCLISPITHYYLNQIILLARMYGIKLRLVAPPIKEGESLQIQRRWETALVTGEMKDFQQLFSEYGNTFVILKNDMFIDHLHFKAGFAPVGYLDRILN